MSATTRITMPTASLGDVEATRATPDDPWEINYPWGAERFYGPARQVRARIKAAIKKHDKAEENA